MEKRIVIAGGGTGGHLYPGIALARALMKHDPKIKPVFIGTQRGVEARVLPKEGFELKCIYAGGLLGKRGWDRWASWAKLPLGLLQSLAFLASRRPALVAGVGGYASGPAVLAAWLLRIPTLIHEQNSFPGVTNRLLGKIANRVVVSFEETRRYFSEGKTVVVGNLIREEFSALKAPLEPEAGGRFTLLVMGGSQGARSINRAMSEALDFMGDVKDQIHILHQTGERDAEGLAERYKEKGFSAEARPFFYDMAERYGKADLMACRSGATTLAEINACGKAAILIPFPHAAHNHQEKNARVMEKAGSAEVILEENLDGKILGDAITKLMRQPERLRTMAQNSFQLGKRDATERARDLCLKLMGSAV